MSIIFMPRGSFCLFIKKTTTGRFNPVVLFIKSLHLFLREYIETVYGVYKHIAWRGVVIAFHTALGINCTFHFLQLMEYIESVSTECEIAF